MEVTKPVKGFIVRTKAGNVKVLCEDCLAKSEFEEYVKSFTSVMSSECIKCRRPVIIRPQEFASQAGKR